MAQEQEVINRDISTQRKDDRKIDLAIMIMIMMRMIAIRNGSNTNSDNDDEAMTLFPCPTYNLLCGSPHFDGITSTSHRQSTSPRS